MHERDSSTLTQFSVTMSIQQAALGALKAGRSWVDNKVKTLDAGRAAILDALSPLETTIGGSGAMYVMAKLPDGTDDMVRNSFFLLSRKSQHTLHSVPSILFF